MEWPKLIVVRILRMSFEWIWIKKYYGIILWFSCVLTSGIAAVERIENSVRKMLWIRPINKRCYVRSNHMNIWQQFTFDTYCDLNEAGWLQRKFCGEFESNDIRTEKFYGREVHSKSSTIILWWSQILYYSVQWNRKKELSYLATSTLFPLPNTQGSPNGKNFIPAEVFIHSISNHNGNTQSEVESLQKISIILTIGLSTRSIIFSEDENSAQVCWK